MKESIELRKEFVERRPIMRQHDTPHRITDRLLNEAGELTDALDNHLENPHNGSLVHVGEELADVMAACFDLAHRLGINLEQSFERKVLKDEIRFPAESFDKGNFTEVYRARKKHLKEL